MAAKLLNVVRVEMLESVVETVKKSKRHDYARGGFRTEETISRVVTSTPRALLECGHWRVEHGTGASVSTAKKLSCWKCERIAYSATHPKD